MAERHATEERAIGRTWVKSCWPMVRHKLRKVVVRYATEGMRGRIVAAPGGIPRQLVENGQVLAWIDPEDIEGLDQVEVMAWAFAIRSWEQAIPYSTDGVLYTQKEQEWTFEEAMKVDWEGEFPSYGWGIMQTFFWCPECGAAHEIDRLGNYVVHSREGSAARKLCRDCAVELKAEAA